MSSSTENNAVEEHVVTALQITNKYSDPFPYFYTTNVFPDDFYAEIQEFLAQEREYLARQFANRKFAVESQIPGLEFMTGKSFFKEMLHLFPDALAADFGGKRIQFYRDLRLIRDSKEYKIGPHTDAPWKVLSLLFYLPNDDKYRNFGTSIFVPRDGTFRCAGGPHYPFEPFIEVWRAPFLPNSCLGFWKTSHSFHGVVPIPIEIRRDVLLFNIYQKQAFDEVHSGARIESM